MTEKILLVSPFQPDLQDRQYYYIPIPPPLMISKLDGCAPDSCDDNMIILRGNFIRSTANESGEWLWCIASYPAKYSLREVTQMLMHYGRF